MASTPSRKQCQFTLAEDTLSSDILKRREDFPITQVPESATKLEGRKVFLLKGESESEPDLAVPNAA